MTWSRYARDTLRQLPIPRPEPLRQLPGLADHAHRRRLAAADDALGRVEGEAAVVEADLELLPVALGRLLAPATSSIAARPAPNERNDMSFSRNTAWHGKPMSWDCASTAEESHKFDKGGIKVGFSGFVPRAAWHYGSSHVGSLPYRDRQNWDFGKKPTAGNRRSRSASWLNPSSAREIGRQAWNIEWVGTGQASLRKFECAPAVTCPASVT